MVDRTERTLTEADLAKIADTYHAWRGTASVQKANLAYVMSASALRSPWSRQRSRHPDEEPVRNLRLRPSARAPAGRGA
ncbi:hypothetical protein [Streptomyces sp. NPDC002785]|uniref:hypothetical protein n=1 Tax=Streptomyces sp. NPDC002785 TaxID=3154543 RepID=UPI003330F26E